MNKIVNKSLPAGDKFISEMHLKQPGSTYSVCGPFISNKQRIERIMQIGDTNYIYKNDIDKAFFNMTWLMANIKTYKQEHNQIKF